MTSATVLMVMIKLAKANIIRIALHAIAFIMSIPKGTSACHSKNGVTILIFQLSVVDLACAVVQFSSDKQIF
jgi:hypothetical protein